MNRLTASVLLYFLLLASTLFAQTRADALVLYNTGRYAQSINVCLREIAENPRNTESYVVLSWSLVKDGRYEEAEQWASQGRNIARYDHRLIEILGEAKYYLGQNAEALSLFQEYVSLVPSGSRVSTVYYLMGEIYLRQGKYRHADIALTTAVRYENLNAEWWTRLGYAREMAAEYIPSLDAYDQALKINPSLTDAVRGKNRVSARLG
ncbi:MAG: tetratricopeptide repeat protein [Spirochaetaceae bacterium]|jgi:tetratricopeptide (TPR) repeat protein|nr:tetratricopeptide repeat protein [Spirochaetaceae bacterium]